MTTQQITNPTPKDRFLSSADNITKHRDMVDNTTFQRACDFAMLQYQALLCSQNQPANFNVTSFKLQGAQEFLEIFRLLGEKPAAVSTSAKADNLNHGI